jgi:hypothetical protein
MPDKGMALRIRPARNKVRETLADRSAKEPGDSQSQQARDSNSTRS